MCHGRYIVFWCKSRTNPACPQYVPQYDNANKRWGWSINSISVDDTLIWCCGEHQDSIYTCLYCDKYGGYTKGDNYVDPCDACKPFWDLQDSEKRVSALKVRALSTQELENLRWIEEVQIPALKEKVDAWMQEGRMKMERAKESANTNI